MQCIANMLVLRCATLRHRSDLFHTHKSTMCSILRANICEEQRGT